LPRGSETILAVEDDAYVREYVVMLLRDLGYRVLEAASAREALALLDDQAPPELLYTDVVLPGGISGPELADQARERLPALRVLYTSGYTATTAIPDGPTLVKPYRKEDLARAIRASLEADARN
jgi:CheY-like chemotaxis protein